MRICDVYVNTRLIEKLALQFDELDKDIIDKARIGFMENKSPDFYEGMFNAYFGIYKLLERRENDGDDDLKIFNPILSYLANIVLRNRRSEN